MTSVILLILSEEAQFLIYKTEIRHSWVKHWKSTIAEKH